MGLLDVAGINVFYGRVQALRGVSLSINAGEIVALIGSNGAGKTTTLRTISGLNHATTGRVVFDGRDISAVPAHEVVRAGIGHAPEGRRLFPRMVVFDNLLMGTYARKDRAGIPSDIARVYDLFPRLKERTKQLAGTLSGGEQQMLAIGRALMARPKLLMLDEPSLGLAPILCETIFRVLTEINPRAVSRRVRTVGTFRPRACSVGTSMLDSTKRNFRTLTRTKGLNAGSRMNPMARWLMCWDPSGLSPTSA